MSHPQALNLYPYVQNDPVNSADPDGLWALQVAGALIGGEANAYKNYSAYKLGQMSGIDYAKSVVFGAVTGILSSFGGPAFGALLAGLNNVHDQALLSNSFPCHEEINWGEAGRVVVIGFAVGNIAQEAYKAGNLVIKLPNIIGAKIGSKATQVFSYGTPSGIIANAAWTFLIN